MPAPQEVRKSILVIKGQANSLQAVEQFLRNREWKIQTTTNLKEALTFLVSQKPSFVMISMDHPNKKVRSLPKILTQAFPVFVMVYSESNTTVSYKNLVDSGCNYRINPPATGPAVERTINKILRDQEIEKERRELVKNSGGANVDGSDITIQGGNGSGDGVTHIGGRGPGTSADDSAEMMPSISDILRQMTEGKDDDSDSSGAAILTSDAAQPDGIAGMLTPEERAARIDAYEAEKLKNANSSEGSLLGGDLLNAEDLAGSSSNHPDGSPSISSRGNTSSNGTWVPLDPPPSSEGADSTQSSTDAPELMARSSGSKGITSERPMARYDEDDINARDGNGKEEDAPVLNFEPAAKRQASASGATQMESSLKDGNLIRTGGNAGKGFSKTESIMVRGTQMALDDSVEIKGERTQEDVQKVQDSSNVACLVVESPRFSGYLVAALGKNRRIDDKFIDTIKSRLFKFLKDNGEDIAEEGTMNLKIKKVDFEDWAMEYAEFLRKSVHNGEEIAMAFFPFADAKTKIGDSASVEMGAVDVHEISPDVPLEFNLYVYLPTNQKYVLYTPRGSKFYGTQKERLIGMGVSHVHVKRTEAQDVDKYRAQNYLNSKIDEFQNRKKVRMPGAS